MDGEQLQLTFHIKLSNKGSYDIMKEQILAKKDLRTHKYENKDIYVDKSLDKDTKSSTGGT